MIQAPLRTRNALQMDTFCSKLVSFILSVTSTLALTNALADYKIRTLEVRNTFYSTGHRLELAGNTEAGNTEGGSITVPLTSCLTGLD